MKFLFLLLAFFILAKANANNYYFSSSEGNDWRPAIEAQNPATPWKSLNKLDSIFSILQPGDSVLFKRGDVFYGSVYKLGLV